LQPPTNFSMTVYRTVQISDDQLPKFEKIMEDNGFEIILNEVPEISMVVQEEMQKRAQNWDPIIAIPADEVLRRLNNRI
jgi:hypothetical protein